MDDGPPPPALPEEAPGTALAATTPPALPSNIEAEQALLGAILALGLAAVAWRARRMSP